MPASRAGNYIAGQLSRSCHSPAFNYEEVQAAGSRADFVHKLHIVLKELKGCHVALKTIIKRMLIEPAERLSGIFKKKEELIAIIAKSIETAKNNKEGKFNHQ